MDNVFQQLQQLTEEISTRIQVANDEELTRFVDTREALIQQILKASLTPEEKTKYRPLVQELVRKDPVILERIQTLKSAAAEELRKIGGARKQKHAYGQEMPLAEGAFFDKRK